MKALIEKYIEDHKNAWAESTRKSELFRLARVDAVLGKGCSPAELWGHLQDLGNYSRATTWTRICAFYDWLIENGHKTGPNPYRAWRKKNARLFKHVYQRRCPDLSFEEALRRVKSIEDREVREASIELLTGGLRACEIARREGDFVRGKGGKLRKVYAGASGYRGSYSKLYRGLKSVGLKPHDLRKLFATELSRRGIAVLDLTEAMGWEDPKTAMSYVKASESRIEKLVREVQSPVAQR